MKNFSLTLSARSRSGYSLIELSIVLVIISILISGALSISTEKLKDDQVQITKERMDRIYTMLAGYIRTNRALPCPASLFEVKSSSVTYGTPVGAAGSCSGSGLGVSANLAVGAVPTSVLGLPPEYAEDGFGAKIFYMVYIKLTEAPDVTNIPNFAATNFSTLATNQLSASPSNLITIRQNPLGTAITANAAFTLFSTGLNKYGAYNANLATQNSTTNADSDEVNNSTNAHNSGVVVSISSANINFDDIVMYKTIRNIVNDYPDLMSLVPCPATTIPGYSLTWYDPAKTSAWYEGVVYSKLRTDCAINQNMRYSFQCGQNGRWITLLNTCSL